MATRGVSNREILDAIISQSNDIEKMEERLTERIDTVKADTEKDVARVEGKVEKLEAQTRKENVVGTVIASAVGSLASFLAFVNR